MVHQFKNNGYDIVLDVNSGAIHVVDDVTYDVIALFEDHSREEIIAQLQSRYPEQEIAEAIEETEQLKEHMTAIWHAAIALRKRANIMEEEP